MATIDDVRRVALALPEVTEKPAWGNATWRVGGLMFVWDRPLRAKERAELGDDAPDGPVMGARVEDLGEKKALLTADPDAFFTVSHFDGHASVLVRLDRVDPDRLAEIVEDAWLARAPQKLAAAYLDQGG